MGIHEGTLPKIAQKSYDLAKAAENLRRRLSFPERASDCDQAHFHPHHYYHHHDHYHHYYHHYYYPTTTTLPTIAKKSHDLAKVAENLRRRPSFPERASDCDP